MSRRKSLLEASALRHWRFRAGLTVEEAADKLGVGKTAYNDWEQGHRPIPPTIEILLKFLTKRK